MFALHRRVDTFKVEVKLAEQHDRELILNESTYPHFNRHNKPSSGFSCRTFPSKSVFPKSAMDSPHPEDTPDCSHRGRNGATIIQGQLLIWPPARRSYPRQQFWPPLTLKLGPK